MKKSENVLNSIYQIQHAHGIVKIQAINICHATPQCTDLKLFANPTQVIAQAIA